MFAYCGSDPVNRKDSEGTFWGIVAAIAAVVAVVITSAHILAINKINHSDANNSEKALAKKDYIAAYRVDQSRKIADKYTDSVYGQGAHMQDDNQANAYRHAMWNAVMTDKIGEKKTIKFANAHEDVPDFELWRENCEMDLHNNALGRKIAIEYAGQGYDVFSQKIQEAINEGEAIVRKWDN